MDPSSLSSISLMGIDVAGAAGDLLSSLTTSADPSTSTITLPIIIEYAALVTGAISGSMKASLRGLDIIGAVTLAMATGLGGGLLRDIVLPTTSIYMLDHPLAVILSIVIGVLVFYFRGMFTRFDVTTSWIDILSVGLFAFVGADKALLAGYGAVSCILMGVLTAVGGGAVRDICLNEVPAIFRRGTYYAIAALGGTVAYIALVELHVAKIFAAGVCVVVTIALRFASLKYNLQSPESIDLTPQVTRPLGHIAASVGTLHRKHPHSLQVKPGHIDEETDGLAAPKRGD